jgi:hypothetical protein
MSESVQVETTEVSSPSTTQHANPATQPVPGAATSGCHALGLPPTTLCVESAGQADAWPGSTFQASAMVPQQRTLQNACPAHALLGLMPSTTPALAPPNPTH